MSVSRYLAGILFVMLVVNGYSQLIDNRIFKIIREESYEQALEYGQHKLGSFRDSAAYYKKAIPYQLGLGMVYRKMGNYSDAEKHYTEARRILKYKETHGRRKKIIDYDVFDELAQMYIDIGNFYEAGELLRAGTEAREKRFDSTNLLRYRSYLVYGNYFLRTGNPDSAYTYFRKYIFYIKNSRHTSKEELNRYADTYRMLTGMELARKNITQALVFAKKNRHLQFHYWTRKEAGKNNLNKILSLDLLSRCYRLLGRYEKSVYYSRKAFGHYDKTIGTETYHLVPLLINRGFISWNKGNFDEAQTDFIRASRITSEFIDKNFKSLSEYEKENFYASMKENFDILNSFALDKFLHGNSQEDTLWSVICNFRIKTKAIILNESNRLAEALRNSGDKELAAQFSEWRRYKNELARKVIMNGLEETDPEIRQIHTNINHLEKSMSEKTFLFRQNEKAPEWKDIRDKLKPTEAAVEVIRIKKYGDIPLANTKYKRFGKVPDKAGMLSDSVAYVFLIIAPGKDKPQAVCVREGDLLEGKYFRQYRNSQLFRIRDEGAYNAFWKPLEQELKGNKNIYFSSDGIYNLINLWILRNPSSGRYLIDDVNIINVTNTRAVLTLGQEKLSIRSALLLGKPNYFLADSSGGNNLPAPKETDRGVSRYFRNGLSDLPGTETEVRRIGNLFSANGIDTKIFLWNQATEQLLKEALSSDILHIATHGYFDSEGQGMDPMLRAGLLFAGVAAQGKEAAGEDGILTAYEASNLNLDHTRLVVLSACETGLGEVKNGEGVYGLQRAFEVAGVHAMLMSMWKVNDETTQELMVAFYRELLKSDSVMSAFKKAQLKIRAKYPDTLYWGAFKLIGK